MNFDYNEEQQLLADSVRRFLAKDYGFEARKKIVSSKDGWSAEVWAQIAEMGITGLPFSPDFGGFGGGAVDLMGVMEAAGDALLVEPYLPTVMAGKLVARAGSDAQKKAILPQVVEGKLKLAFAHTEKGARYNLSKVSASAKGAGAGWELTGEKAVVLGATAADKLVVSANTGKGMSLFLVDVKDAKLKGYVTLDEMRAADVVLKGTKGEMLGAEGGALALVEEVVDYATALVCAEAVGAMKFSCDTTLEYLKTRKQFGVTIGNFQALQHRMVDMYVSYEQAKSMACLACSKVDSPADAKDRARAVSAAKIKIADNARHISQEAIQLHGGMGMTDEMKVSHSFRRLTMIAQQFGDAEHHLARFAKLS
ncbi:MAG: acyl-CoA dehydrogenase [Proteobacteria bacterium]|nr:acyl-CoA dehydrogenase [Pseudomonadota bacterium]MDA0981490.1 acyl-CoA dehydrogenase [Pseudomonadota bacterium]